VGIYVNYCLLTGRKREPACSFETLVPTFQFMVSQTIKPLLVAKAGTYYRRGQYGTHQMLKNLSRTRRFCSSLLRRYCSRMHASVDSGGGSSL